MHTRDLSADALGVRDTLFTAREPVRLLFRDLPAALNLRPFEPGELPDAGRVDRFVAALRGSVEELRAAYARLLGRLLADLSDAFGLDGPLDRDALAERAERVAFAAREPRLRAFALRLADVKLHEDAWIESFAGLVTSKPPRGWRPGDEARFREDLAALVSTFRNVETVAFRRGSAPETTFKVELTRADGEAKALVLDIHAQGRVGAERGRRRPEKGPRRERARGQHGSPLASALASHDRDHDRQR